MNGGDELGAYRRDRPQALSSSVDENFTTSNQPVSIKIEINRPLFQLAELINQIDLLVLESGVSLNNIPRPKKLPIIKAANIKRKPHRIIKEG